MHNTNDEKIKVLREAIANINFLLMLPHWPESLRNLLQKSKERHELMIRILEKK